jgi:hypothetical protein
VNTPSQHDARDQRLISHALVEVRKIRWLGLFAESAVLLDLSLGGFKLEFTSEAEAEVGRQYWLHIPLRPLGIQSRERFDCKVECRWYDEARFRMGGIFLELNDSEKNLLRDILDALQGKQQQPLQTKRTT